MARKRNKGGNHGGQPSGGAAKPVRGGIANLVPNSERTPEERRENARKAGKASGVARRRKRDMAAIATALLSSKATGETREALREVAPGLDDEDATLAATVAATASSTSPRPPAATRASRSRPCSSVPSGCAASASAQGGNANAARFLVELDERGRLAEQVEDAPFERDFGLLLAPPYLALHRDVERDEGIERWLRGGRFSGKSSVISLEVAYGLMRHPGRSAFVMPKIGQDIEGGVFEQMLWAFRHLGCEDEWVATKRPCKLARPSTGQVVTFKGGDRSDKTKAIKAPSGTYYAYQWISEVDQFGGMPDVRTVLQSVTRDAPEGAVYFRFFDYNPPRSRDAWVNEHVAGVAASSPDSVISTTYLDMPREWVPEQVYRDAEALRELDEDAWRHEWGGESTGYGAEVFPRAEVREVTADERRRLQYRLYGVDWGFSVDPWVWLEVAYDARARTLYVLGEMSGVGLSNAETAAMAVERMSRPTYEAGYEPTGDAAADAARVVADAEPYAEVMCDSAEPKSVADWRAEGVNAVPVPKQGAHNVRNSVRWLQDRASIVVDPSCEVAARELTCYQYVLTRDGKPTGMLPDADNHAIDALRYAVARLIDDPSMV